MANKIPVDTLYYSTIVTRDAKALARRHSELYGISRWSVVRHTQNRLTEITYRGRRPTVAPPINLSGSNPIPGEYSFISATGTSDDESVSFQLIQPTGGLSTFEHFLVTRGQGVHGLCMSVVSLEDFGPLRDWLSSESILIAQSFTVDNAASYFYFDTRHRLGGWYLQVIVPLSPDWKSRIVPDEIWEFSPDGQRHANWKPKVNGITHFGVVVPDVEHYVENFARLFKQPLWRGMNWRTEPGSLEDTTSDGIPVDHAYFTGRADIGKTPGGVSFGFEIIQPTFGPSHYKENFLEKLGPGIHHIDLQMPIGNWDDWHTFNAWLAEDFDAPCCMSGKLRGGQHLFQYQDTRRNLGYVIEIHAPDNPIVPRTRSAPDYWHDFSGKWDFS